VFNVAMHRFAAKLALNVLDKSQTADSGAHHVQIDIHNALMQMIIGLDTRSVRR
jgi:hypothetical protein